MVGRRRLHFVHRLCVGYATCSAVVLCRLRLSDSSLLHTALDAVTASRVCGATAASLSRSWCAMCEFAGLTFGC